MEQSKEQAGNKPCTIHDVMPSFLTHPYAQVVCTNKGELNYVLEWAKQNGKEVADFYYKVEKFPYHLFLAGEIVFNERIHFLKGENLRNVKLKHLKKGIYLISLRSVNKIISRKLVIN